MEESPHRYPCGCGKSFKHRSGIYKHSKKCNKSTSIFSPLSRKPCGEENCQYTYRYIEELRNHLETDHAYNIVTETILLDSYEDFIKWKEEYEKKTVSSFTRNNIKKGKIGNRCARSTEYYYCHRSGQYKCVSKGKRKLKAQGSLKINHNCTAALKVTTLANQSVKLFVCHTHYGHNMDLIHVKISKKDREILIEQLNQGVSKEKILHTLAPCNALTLERKHLIMRKDLNNISRAYGLKSVERLKQYRLNVEEYVQEHIADETGAVLLYKRKKEEGLALPENTESSLSVNDFAVAIMNQVQKEVFQSYGHGIVCIDETYDNNADFQSQIEGVHSDNLYIFSVLVIDDFGDAIPVAWLISNKEDPSLLTLFFQQLKNVAGDIIPKAILTDRSSDCYNCWIDVFGGETMKLLCCWHVYHEWQQKLFQIDDQDAASVLHKALCMLLEEQDLATFAVLLQRCLKEMNDSESLCEFGRYFSEEWAIIQEQWAICFRTNIGLDTKLHMEPFHQTFKHLFLLERFKKSPNKCLNLILNFSSDLNMKRHQKSEFERCKIMEAHKTVSGLSLELVKQVSDGVFYVTSEDYVYGNSEVETVTQYSFVYMVEEQNKVCFKSCNVKCDICGVCIHIFKCSCGDSENKTEICQHSHLVAWFLLQEPTLSIQELLPETSEEQEEHAVVGIPKQEPLEEEEEEDGYINDSRDGVSIIEMVDHTYFECRPRNPKPTAVSCQTECTPREPQELFIVQRNYPKNMEDLKSTIIQNLRTLCSKVKECVNEESLNKVHNYIKTANSVWDTPEPKNSNHYGITYERAKLIPRKILPKEI